MAGGDVGSALVVLPGEGVRHLAVPLLAWMWGFGVSVAEFAIISAEGERWLPRVEGVTAEGERVWIAELPGGQPMVVLPFYTRCPQTCSLLLAGWRELARDLGMDGVRWVAVSFDPAETCEALRQYARRWELEGWTLVRADSMAIERLLQALGLTVRWDSVFQLYEHPNVALVVTPTGRVSRFISGLRPERGQVRLALWEARRDGGRGAVVEGVLLRCFRFDASKRRYVVDWGFVVELCSGFAFVVSVLVWMVWEGRRHSRRKRLEAPRVGAGGGGQSGGLAA